MSHFSRTALATACVLALAATSARAAERKLVPPPAPSHRVYAYVCLSTGACGAYEASGKPVRTISQGLSSPQGIATDSHGRLYVASAGNASVVVFAAGGTKTVATLQDAGYAPASVAVSESTQTIAVANGPSTSGYASVSVYQHGATSPTRVLTDTNGLDALAVAFDAGGTCYLLYDNGAGGRGVDAFARCAGVPSQTGITAHASDITFDGESDLYYTATVSGSSDTAVWKCRGLGKCRELPVGQGLFGALRFNAEYTTLIFGDGPGVATSFAPFHRINGYLSLGSSVYPTGVALATGPAD